MAEKSSQEIIDGIEKAIEELADMIVKEVSKRPAPKADAKPTENKCCEQKTMTGNAIEDLKKRVIALEASSEVDLNYLADMKADIKTIQDIMDNYGEKILTLEKHLNEFEKKITEKLDTTIANLHELEDDVDDLNFSVNDIYTEMIVPKAEEEEEEEDVCEDEDETESENEEDVEKTIIGILDLHNFSTKDFIDLITKLSADYIKKH
jgi:chromosome segregation ATPase